MCVCVCVCVCDNLYWRSEGLIAQSFSERNHDVTYTVYRFLYIEKA